MSWIITKRDESQKIILLTGKDYVFGRKEVDVILSNDMSISRMHSIIRVEYSPTNVAFPQRIPIVTIKDTSKYGTTVNGKKLETGGASCFLNNNDIILFGIFENVWKITYTPFVCATSGLSKSDKLSVNQNIVRIGGHLVNEWSDACTHLIMSNIFMSMKVVNALVSGTPILMPKYLDDIINEKSWPVHLKKYESPAVKSSFYSDDANFQPDARRKNIFKEKNFFVFSSKQELKFRFPVTKTGGIVTSVPSITITEDLISNDKSCFLEPSKESIGNGTFTKIINLLKRHGKRFISEAEIGLSILSCSTDKYCNPKAPGDRLLFGSIPETQFSMESQLSVSETQSSNIFEVSNNTLMDFENITSTIKPSIIQTEISTEKQREMPTKVQKEIPIKVQKVIPSEAQKEIVQKCKKIKLEPDIEIKIEPNVTEVIKSIENDQSYIVLERPINDAQPMEIDEVTVKPKFDHLNSGEKNTPSRNKMFSDKFICARNKENGRNTGESDMALVKIKIQSMTRSNQSNGSTSFAYSNANEKKYGNKCQKTFKKVPPKTYYPKVSFQTNRSTRS